MIDYEVIVCTTTKRNDYLESTCDSLISENLWAPFKNVKISVDDRFHTLDRKLGIGAQWKFMSNVFSKPRQRATMNFVQALRWGSGNLLLVEDDVIACKNASIEIQSYLKMRPRDSFLSFYNVSKVENEKMIFERPWYDFWGLQAIFIPWHFRENLANHIEKRKFSMPHDHALADWCRISNIPIYEVTRSVFQHTGRKTTGLSDGLHTSPNFLG